MQQHGARKCAFVSLFWPETGTACFFNLIVGLLPVFEVNLDQVYLFLFIAALSFMFYSVLGQPVKNEMNLLPVPAFIFIFSTNISTAIQPGARWSWVEFGLPTGNKLSSGPYSPFRSADVPSCHPKSYTTLFPRIVPLCPGI